MSNDEHDNAQTDREMLNRFAPLNPHEHLIRGNRLMWEADDWLDRWRDGQLDDTLSIRDLVLLAIGHYLSALTADVLDVKSQGKAGEVHKHPNLRASHHISRCSPDFCGRPGKAP